LKTLNNHVSIATEDAINIPITEGEPAIADSWMPYYPALSYLMLLVVALLTLTGWGDTMSLISDTLTRGVRGGLKIFFGWLKDTPAGDRDNAGEDGREGGGTEVSTLGSGTTPDMV